MQKEPISPAGLERLKEKLHQLKTKERPAIVQMIAVARAHGDLKENAEYHEAKDKQGLLEARIRDLEHLLAMAQVIDHKEHKTDKVIFGATVTVLNLDTDQKKTYQIVGKFETDIKAGKIPISAPIARGLIGKKVGDVASVQVPKGIQEFEILKIEFL